MTKYKAVNGPHARNEANRIYELDADNLNEAVCILIGKRYNAINRTDTHHEILPKNNIPLANVNIYSGAEPIEHWSVQDIILPQLGAP